jgi:hypothetical protein
MSIKVIKSAASINARSGINRSSTELRNLSSSIVSGRNTKKDMVSVVESLSLRSQTELKKSKLQSALSDSSFLTEKMSMLKRLNNELRKLQNLASDSASSVVASVRQDNVNIFDVVKARVDEIGNQISIHDSKIPETQIIREKVNGSIDFSHEVFYSEAVMNGAPVATKYRITAMTGNKTRHITCAGVQNNDTITVNGVVFTFKTDADPLSETEIQISDNIFTAKNAIKKINEYSGEATKRFLVTRDVANPARINFETLSGSGLAIGVSSSNGTRLAVQASSNVFDGVDTSYADKDESLIGQMGSLTIISARRRNSGGLPVRSEDMINLRSIAVAAGNSDEVPPLATPQVAGNYASGGFYHISAGTAAWQCEFTIGGVEYRAYAFQRNYGSGHDAERVFCVRKDRDGFSGMPENDSTVRDKTGYGFMIDIVPEGAQGNFWVDPGVDDAFTAGTGFRDQFNIDAARIKFYQTRPVAISSRTDLIKSGLAFVGSTRGMSAYLTSSSKETMDSFPASVESIEISDSSVMKFTLKNSEGEERIFESGALGSLVNKGSAITLTATDNDDQIRIVVGSEMDMNLSKKSYREAIAEELEKSFGMTINEYEVEVNKDYSLSKLTSSPVLDVSTQDGSAEATKAINGAIKEVAALISDTQAKLNIVESKQKEISLMKESQEIYLSKITDVDPTESQEEASSALKNLNGSIASMEGITRVNSLKYQLLKV